MPDLDTPTGHDDAGRPNEGAWWHRAAFPALAVLLMAATSAPYLVAAVSTQEGETFTGLVFNATDTNQYLAWIRDGSQLQVLFFNRFTPEPHPALLLKPFFLVLGWLSALTGLAPVAVYHLARLIMCLAIVWGIDRFTRTTLARPLPRLAATAVACFSGGLGMPLQRLGVSFPERLIEQPIDFWVPEIFVFQTAYLFPHLLFALLLMLLIIERFHQGLVSGTSRPIAAAAGLAVLLALVHPFDLVVVHTTIGALTLLALWWRRRHWRFALTALVVVAAPSSGVVGLNAMVLNSHEAFATMLSSSQTTPSFSQVALGLGAGPVLLALVLIPLGQVWLSQRRPPENLQSRRARKKLAKGAGAHRRSKRPLDRPEWPDWIVPAVMLATIVLLVTLPVFALRRRFLMGIGIPVAILLIRGIHSLAQRWFQRSLRLRRVAWAGVAVLMALLLLPGSVLRPLHDLEHELGPPHRRAAYYHTEGQRAVFEWLQVNASGDDVVLSDWRTSNTLPAYTDVRVYAGHWNHTVDYRRRIGRLRHVLQTGRGAHELVRDNRIALVVVLRAQDRGRRLQTIFGGLPGAEVVFRHEEAVVIRVAPGEAKE